MPTQAWPSVERLFRARNSPHSLRTLITALILAMIMPIIGLSLLIIVRSSAAEHVASDIQHLSIARAFSSEVDRRLQNAETTLRALATSPDLARGDVEAFYRQCATVAAQHNARVMLFDPAAVPIFNTRVPFGTPLPDKRPATPKTAAETQTTQITNLFLGVITEERLVAVSVPVLEHEATRYVLAMAFHPEVLSRFFSEQKVPDDWTIGIVDRNGTLVGRNRMLDQYLGKPVTGDLKAAMDERPEGYAILVTKDGIEVYTAFTRSAYSGWTVAFGVPRAMVDAPLWRSLGEIGTGGSLLLLLCLGIAALAARRISRAMNSLATAALAVGRGEPVLQTSSGIAEMDRIGTSLTRASETLAKRAAERDRAELLLHEALDSISEGFAFFDRNDCLVMCNEAYRNMAPMDPARIVPGIHFEEIQRAGIETGQIPEAIGREEEWITERLQHHRELDGPAEQLLNDGRWLMISEQRTKSGGTAGLRIDVTALKDAEAELRESREHMARAQQISRVGSLEHDLRTGEVTCSKEFCRILGVKPDRFQPSLASVMELVHPDDRVMAEAAAREADASGTPAPTLEYRIMRSDGTIRFIRRENEFFCDNTGRLVRKLITFLDITEIRAVKDHEEELQRQLIHSQKLEAVGTLAAGIAHDFNNTLVPIVALSKLLLDELPEGSEAHHDVEVIVDASERARDLVKRILAFSRKEVSQRAPTSLTEVIRQAVQMLRATLPATVRLDEETADVPLILGDAGQLLQVIVNLVTNAAHAIGSEVGAISIALFLPPEDGCDFIRLSIADTGCGMDQATADRIFEPFYTTKSVGEGTGLGLSVVHRIIADHEGTIKVDSVPGKGTQFDIFLPIARTVTGTAEAIASS